MTVLHSARSYVQSLLHLLLSCLCFWRQFYDLAISVCATVASPSVSLLAFKVKIELFYYNGFRYKMAGRPLLVLVWSPPEEILNQDESSCDQPSPDSYLGDPREPVWSSASRGCLCLKMLLWIRGMESGMWRHSHVSGRSDHRRRLCWRRLGGDFRQRHKTCVYIPWSRLEGHGLWLNLNLDFLS